MIQKTLFALLILYFFSGCTQVVTAPISIAGSVAEATIDVAAIGVGVVVGSDDEEEKDD